MAGKKFQGKNRKKDQKIIPTGELLPQAEFLAKYHIPKDKFVKSGLKWCDLIKIFKNYQTLRDKLEHPAQAIVAILFTKDAKERGVHSVRYRIKDPNSLIDKIIRKKIKEPERVITLENYKDQITDLVGIRILHTFKYDCFGIHCFLTEQFSLKTDESPIVYYREGDEEEFIKLCCNNMGCKSEPHDKGYRSIHYIISTQLTREIYFAEIQVRTIFEEGWSEIDHKIRYSFKSDSSSPFDQQLKSLNTAAGHADEIGTIIKQLEQQEQEKILKTVRKRRGK